MSEYLVAITGASGAAYGVRLVRELLRMGEGVGLVVSPSGFLILKEELGLDFTGKDIPKVLKPYLEEEGKEPLKGRLSYFQSDDLMAAYSSGSFRTKAVVVCPCSMGTLSRIASGASTNLIERAADCQLKEGRKLVLVPRETPLNQIHLENMLKLSRAGAVILPAMPAFYNHPQTIEDMVNFVAGKALDALGVENSIYKRWKKQP